MAGTVANLAGIMSKAMSRASLLSTALIAACASVPEYRPLEAYLKPPAVRAGDAQLLDLFELQARYVTGLYNLRQRHLNAIEPQPVSRYHNQQCADLLEAEIRGFPWPETRPSFDAVIRRISDKIERQHCHETKPRFVGQESGEPPRMIPATAQE